MTIQTAEHPATSLEPYLIMLEVTITEGSFVGLSYKDPKPPNTKHYGRQDIGLEDLILIFEKIGLKDNIVELKGTGKRTVFVEMFANLSRLTALGFNAVGARTNEV